MFDRRGIEVAVREMDEREHLGAIEGMAMHYAHEAGRAWGDMLETEKAPWREKATTAWREKLNTAGHAAIIEEDELVRRAVRSLETIAGLAVKLANPPMVMGADGKVERLGGMPGVEDAAALSRIASALERLADVYAPRPVAYPAVDELGDETGETPMPGWKSARGL